MQSQGGGNDGNALDTRASGGRGGRAVAVRQRVGGSQWWGWPQGKGVSVARLSDSGGRLETLNWAKMENPPVFFLDSTSRPQPAPSPASRVLVRETLLSCVLLRARMLAGILHLAQQPMKGRCKIDWLPHVSLSLRVPVERRASRVQHPQRPSAQHRHVLVRSAALVWRTRPS